MEHPISEDDNSLASFYSTCFDVKLHLAKYLELTNHEIEKLLPKASSDLASLHSGPFDFSHVNDFYEKTVGTAHLFELAAWHLSSSEYIADTLRLTKMFARGQVLDFGGGIGTHALYAASLNSVEHVWFVDLNPHNRTFLRERSKQLGLEDRISVHRDLESINNACFDTLVCFRIF